VAYFFGQFYMFDETNVTDTPIGIIASVS